jgi:hypothetical protein
MSTLEPFASATAFLTLVVRLTATSFFEIMSSMPAGFDAIRSNNFMNNKNIK